MNGLRVTSWGTSIEQRDVDFIFNQMDEISFSFAPLQKSIDFEHDIINKLNANQVDIAIMAGEDKPYPLPPGIEVIALIKKDIAIINQNPVEREIEEQALKQHIALIAKEGSAMLKAIFNPIDIRASYGKAYIVGAGPGDPDLITVKAKKILQKADVILYDSLANPEFLQDTHSENIYMGKRKDNHTFRQDEMNAIFFRYVAQGKNTVRLKGGDPMIFGRGGEEFDYMRQRLVQLEVIPGISAAIGASSYAAIPLTYRNKSASVSFMTGYPENKTKYPDTDTLVYYMGASNAYKIANELIKRGRAKDTPVAIVRNATLPDEEKKFTNLFDLSIQKTVPVSPAVLIIGEVARNNYYKAKTRYVPNILFTGTNCSNYLHLGNVIHSPLLAFEPIRYSVKELQNYFNRSTHYVVFTSKYAVRYFMKNLSDAGYDSRWLGDKKIISIGKNTTKALQQHFLNPDEQMRSESSSGIINWFKEHAFIGKNVLLPRSDKALAFLSNALKQLHLNVTDFLVYKNIPHNYVYHQELSTFDAIIFTSPSTVDYFIAIYGEIPDTLSIISRGEQTTKKLIKSGINPITLEEFELKFR